MPAKRSVALALAALLALSAGAAAGAHGDHAHENADHAQDEQANDAEAADNGSAPDDAGEPPEAAYFGLCTAWGHIPSQAQDAGPFSALTQALCDDVEHPSEGHAEAPHDAGKPAEAGPPS